MNEIPEHAKREALEAVEGIRGMVQDGANKGHNGFSDHQSSRDLLVDAKDVTCSYDAMLSRAIDQEHARDKATEKDHEIERGFER